MSVFRNGKNVSVGEAVPEGGSVGDILEWDGASWIAVANSGGTPPGSASGSLLRWNGAAWESTDASNALLDSNGRLNLPSTSTSGGITIGGDWTLYRYSAGEARTTNAIRIDNDLKIGFGGAAEVKYYASSATVRASAIIAGDSYHRWKLYTDGKQEWGGGSTAVDVNLYRHSTDVLQTDDVLRSERSSASEVGFATRVAGDTNSRHAVYSDGKTEWGPGAADPRDVNLYRSSANVLKSDDRIHGDDGITTKTKAGIPADGDFQSTPSDGTVAVNTSTDELYFRSSGTWQAVAGGSGVQLGDNNVWTGTNEFQNGIDVSTGGITVGVGFIDFLDAPGAVLSSRQSGDTNSRVEVLEDGMAWRPGSGSGMTGFTITGGNAMEIHSSAGLTLAGGGEEIGFFGVATTTRAANIADPTGGSTQDAEARTAIAGILDLLEAYGLMDV